MTRSSRLDVPDVPHHVVHRGNNRQACFADDTDRRRYLEDLLQSTVRHEVEVHAYVLMDNHVHLLATPRRKAALSRAIQLLGRRFVSFVNARHARTGTLWEGRFKSSPVGTSNYLWNCYRYIELNPVRAGLCSLPSQYRWSSHGGNAHGMPDYLITPHAEYLDLACDAAGRAASYRSMFDQDLPDVAAAEVRKNLAGQRAFGDAEFQALVSAKTGREARLRRPGRPARRAS